MTSSGCSSLQPALFAGSGGTLLVLAALALALTPVRQMTDAPAAVR